MIKERISIQDVCNLLNEMLDLDYEATSNLIACRVECNEKIEKHPTIQVQKLDQNAPSKVGIIGVLNGMFGIREDGMGAIALEIDDDKRIIGFKPTPD